ncbi:hypothetical protein N656DRAFT_771314 [Canariomyces notabilis]|uniref:Uncharacterized protein n=1 Tax=Canariomyces notabilis TaxID=2074819 RepID=A0AAN6QLZ3_9PEZI|nr:hypothetical protein N656DRAFT_771314 [Canariomyces arenarius]
MCVTTPASNGPAPQPITTNLGVGQCAGPAAAGAEILDMEDAHVPHRRHLPASVSAAHEGMDDPEASFELLFASSGDYDCACEDMQMVLLEFVADPVSAGHGSAAGHVRSDSF